MTDNPWMAVATALFLWWFFTGAILWRVKAADNGGPEQHLWSVLLGLPLLGAGFYGVVHTVPDGSPQGAYLAFLSALAIWGWIELAFLSGIVTGPNTRECPEGATEWDRFLRGFGTLAWHETLLVVALLALIVLSKDAVNSFALYTFIVLFFARISAKLNLFLGVPRINTEFLPRPLAHLSSHFRRATMNPLFPVSITTISFASACWMERVWSAPTPGAVTGFTLLAALTLLALLEHWFMVLPLPDQKLWRWMIPAPKPIAQDRLQEDVHGL
ncbi:putative photosynthetic complex assembly protein PuhE [Paracoccaceae bacterium Fryx2]|nr:putative photosynthetic complex assembly protein PuhE [Paracoccaceae bacterium Fryx2]